MGFVWAQVLVRNLLFILVFLPTLVLSLTIPSPVIDSDWLSQNLDAVIVLDVRQDSQDFNQKGHIENAILVESKKIRVSRIIDNVILTGMRPEKATFEQFMSEHGVSNDSVVVITHQGQTPVNVSGAARLYWQMKYYGFDQVALLDGGNAAWVVNMEDLFTESTKPKLAKFVTYREDFDILATISEVKSAMVDNQITLVDTRSLRFHVGLDKKSLVDEFGHIPTSKVFSYKFLHPEKGVMTFPSKQQIKTQFNSLNIDPDDSIIVYCNTGYLSASVWFILHEIYGNNNVQVYDGSLHQWTKSISNPMTRVLGQ
jgi:thiosulfate/3-mercaptopyruvate sulfurtransferase